MNNSPIRSSHNQDRPNREGRRKRLPHEHLLNLTDHETEAQDEEEAAAQSEVMTDQAPEGCSGLIVNIVILIVLVLVVGAAIYFMAHPR